MTITFVLILNYSLFLAMPYVLLNCDKIRLVQLYFQSGSLTDTQRKFSSEKNIKRKNDAPSVQQIRCIIKKFQKTGCINNEHNIRSYRACEEKRKDIDSALKHMIAEGNVPSVRKLSSISGSSIGTVHTHLRRDLKLFPYKVSIGQSLSDNHKANRYAFCKRMISNISKDHTFLSRILWTDECSFNVNGWVNRQNLRFWGTEKSHDVVEYSTFSPKINIFIGMTSSFLIGPYFFEHDGQSETINSERYLDMLINYVIPKLKSSPRFNRIIFQQDGAAPHIARQVRVFLENTFGSEKVISRGFPNEWPANSPDLTPLDFWLWSFLKELIYPGGNRPNTLKILKERIIKAVQSVTEQNLQNAVENIKCRLEACLENEGGHFE